MAAPPVPTPDRTSHPYHMHDMIREIPEAIRETLRRNGPRFAELAGRADGRSSLVLTGCGTAFYAAMLAQAGLRMAGDRGASHSVHAFELPRHTRLAGPASAVVGLSHSGITKPTVDALRSSRAAGALTVGITHFDGRPIADAAEWTLLAGNGPDLSRCHTKCYVAAAVAAASLGAALLREWGTNSPAIRGLDDGLQTLPGLIERLIPSTEPEAQRLAATYRKARDIYIVGAGPNEVTALEVALKLKESSFVHSEGVALEQFAHGSWLALDRGSVLIVIAPRGPSRDRALDLLHAAQGLGVQTVAVASEGDSAVASSADAVLSIPEVDEYLSAYLAVVPLYLFAYHSAVARANNPDYLRYVEPSWWQARNLIFPPGTH